MHRILYGPLLTLVALSGVIAVLPASAAPAYVAIPLTLGGIYSRANGINPSGQVTGCSDRVGDPALRAFLYSAPTRATSFSPPGSPTASTARRCRCRRP